MIAAGSPQGGLLAAIGRRVTQAETAAVLIGVGVLFGSVLWGVLTRYVSHQPAAWTGEVAAIAFCWAGFIGAALIYGGGHPRVFDSETIGSALLRRVLGWLSFGVQVVVLVIAGILALKQIGINMSNPTAVLRLPGAIFYLPIAWFSVSALTRLFLRR